MSTINNMWKYCWIIFLLLACENTKHEITLDIRQYSKNIIQHRASYVKALSSEQGPIDSTGISGISFFNADEHYNCLCKLEKYSESQPFQMSTYAGTVKNFLIYGIATCPILDQEVRLEIYQNLQYFSLPGNKYKGFIPFRDPTNGELTYGGGRYMDIQLDTIPTDNIRIDFNKAYNPYCAYSDGYFCPIPPIANHLNMPINAGEKIYKGPKFKRTTGS